MMTPTRALSGLLLLALVCGCAPQTATPPAATAKPPESADEFIAHVNKDLTVLAREGNAAGWTEDTYINVDTQLLNARSTDRAKSIRYSEYSRGS